MWLFAVALAQSSTDLQELEATRLRVAKARAIVTARLDAGETLTPAQVDAVRTMQSMTSDGWRICMQLHEPAQAKGPLGVSAAADEVLKACIAHQDEFVGWFRLNERIWKAHSETEIGQMAAGFVSAARKGIVIRIEEARRKP